VEGAVDADWFGFYAKGAKPSAWGQWTESGGWFSGRGGRLTVSERGGVVGPMQCVRSVAQTGRRQRYAPTSDGF
jgi:hypothetical protein